MQSKCNLQIKLPPFSKQLFFMAVLMLVVCNGIFWILAILTQTARPIISLDYFLAMALFCIPNKLLKLLGVFIFFIAIVFDIMMFTMQLFPFMDIDGFLYFLPFIKVAPLLYQAMAILAVVFILIIPFLLIKLSQKTDLYHILILIIPLSIIGYFMQHLQYHQRDLQKEMFGANNFYYIASQVKLYNFNKIHGFLSENNLKPTFVRYQGDYVSKNLTQSNKILFIVSESWGRFKSDELHNEIMAGLLKNKEKFEFFNEGYFPYQDATVNGEFRELCQLQVKGFAFDKMGDELDNCLPNSLKKLGHKTIALHGASGGLYERYDWYPKAGFDKKIFSENLMGKSICQPFRGVCDAELFDLVRQSFSQNDKLFFYWLTLTSHYPYDLKDLQTQYSLSCSKYGMDDNHEFCHNAKLHLQFFDELAKLIIKPEMRGVEVVVVGDHIPPSKVLLDSAKYLKNNSVAWVHFKIK